MMQPSQVHHRLKRAELLGSAGAVVLGAGVGLLFARFLIPYTIPLLITGLLTHAWGMFDKHRLEKASAGVRLWWEESLYWGCWIALLILAIYIALSR